VPLNAAFSLAGILKEDGEGQVKSEARATFSNKDDRCDDNLIMIIDNIRAPAIIVGRGWVIR